MTETGRYRTAGQEITDRFATHSLKVVPPYFQAVFDQDKTFEVRRNDRGFQRGDLLILNEWHVVVGAGRDGCGACYHAKLSGEAGHYTGSKTYRWVTYVYAGDPRFAGVEAGCVVLGLAPAPEWPDESADARSQT